MNYRKDIQIMRGIAVLLVVLYHLGFSGFQSGFLGVDAFFVISGFLMTVLYNHNNKSEFYVRRCRRLLPAYFATIFLTLVAAAAITLPNELYQVVEQSVYGIFLCSNIGFWMHNSYFSKSEFNPLLHLWSIGVEIQYYLIIPMIYWAFRKLRISLVGLMAGSMGVCFYLLEISTKTSFFLMPLRIWEFLIGFVIAKYFSEAGNIKSERFNKFGGVALAVLVAIPAMKVDGESLGFMSSQPGLHALIVCVATATVLACGIPKLILNSKLAASLEILGKYSYSVYLAHFPIIVLYLYKPFSGTILKPNSWGDTVVLVLLITVFSIAIYRCVENPGRNLKISIKKIYIPLGLLVICALVSFLPRTMYSSSELAIFEAGVDQAEYRCGKFFRILHPTALSCAITKTPTSAEKVVMLVGNSHADSIKASFAKSAERHGVAVYLTVANRPFLEGGPNVEKIVAEAKKKGVSEIVLHFSPHEIRNVEIEQVINVANQSNISVSLIMPVPVYEEHIPEALWKNISGGVELPIRTSLDYNEFNRKLISQLKSFTAKQLRVYETVNYFCEDSCSIFDSSGKPIYFDSEHLTLSGAVLLEPLFDVIFESK